MQQTRIALVPYYKSQYFKDPTGFIQSFPAYIGTSLLKVPINATKSISTKVLSATTGKDVFALSAVLGLFNKYLPILHDLFESKNAVPKETEDVL